MTNFNKVLQLTSKEKFKISMQEMDKHVKHDYVRISIEYCGICGTDHLSYSGQRKENYPVCLGHEHCGTIIKLSDINNNIFKLGDFVAIDPNYRCGKCKYCKSSYGHLCDEYLSSFFSNKGFASFVDIHESYLVKLPNYKKRYIGALVEPLSVALHALDISGICDNDVPKEICILGLGGIGALLALSILWTCNNIKFTIYDTINDKTRRIKNIYGDRIEILNKLSDGESQFDYVFDVGGTIQGFSDACRILAKRGTLIVVSRYYGEEPKLSNSNLIWKEPVIRISHINGERTLMEKAAILLEEHWNDNFDHLIKIYSFDEVEIAFKDFKSHSANKKIIKM